MTVSAYLRGPVRAALRWQQAVDAAAAVGDRATQDEVARQRAAEISAEWDRTRAAVSAAVELGVTDDEWAAWERVGGNSPGFNEFKAGRVAAANPADPAVLRRLREDVLVTSDPPQNYTDPNDPNIVVQPAVHDLRNPTSRPEGLADINAYARNRLQSAISSLGERFSDFQAWRYSGGAAEQGFLLWLGTYRRMRRTAVTTGHRPSAVPSAPTTGYVYRPGLVGVGAPAAEDAVTSYLVEYFVPQRGDRSLPPAVASATEFPYDGTLAAYNQASSSNVLAAAKLPGYALIRYRNAVGLSEPLEVPVDGRAIRGRLSPNRRQRGAPPVWCDRAGVIGIKLGWQYELSRLAVASLTPDGGSYTHVPLPESGGDAFHPVSAADQAKWWTVEYWMGATTVPSDPPYFRYRLPPAPSPFPTRLSGNG